MSRDFHQKKIVIASTEENAENEGIFSCLSRLPASKGIFVVLTAYARCLGKRQIRGRLEFETFLPDISSKYRQADPRKSAKKIVRFQEKLRYMFKEGFYYPGQKKRSIPEIAARRTLFPSCDIMLDDARSAHGKSRGQSQMTLPCVDRASSSMISKVEQRSSRRESRGWFFFCPG